MNHSFSYCNESWVITRPGVSAAGQLTFLNFFQDTHEYHTAKTSYSHSSYHEDQLLGQSTAQLQEDVLYQLFVQRYKTGKYLKQILLCISGVSDHKIRTGHLPCFCFPEGYPQVQTKGVNTSESRHCYYFSLKSPCYCTGMQSLILVAI